MKKKHEPLLKKSLLTSSILLALSTAQSAVIVADANCSLQDAIASANTDSAVGFCSTGSGDDVIVLDPSIDQFFANPILSVPSVAEPGTQVGYPIIESLITINGSNSLIQGPTSSNLRLFEVSSTGALVLNDVILDRADDGIGKGSGVLNDGGDLELNNVTITNTHNAIYNRDGVLRVNDSLLTNNFSKDVVGTAGIVAKNSLVTINKTSLINNFTYGVPPQILRIPSGIQGISEIRGTGAIYLQTSDVTITNSTISGNRGNYVGAIGVGQYVPPVPFSSQNKGGYGESLRLRHVTISNNLGAIAGGLMSISNNVQFTIQGNIIAGNNAYFYKQNNNMSFIYGSNVTANAHNFFGSNNEDGVEGITLGEMDHVFSGPIEDNLYPLNYSDGIFIHPLKHGSAAIDGLQKSCYGNVFIDQEGKSRGIDGNGDGAFICDAGAFEHSMPIVVNDGPCDLSNAIISANNDASVGGCQPGNGHDIIQLSNGSVHVATNISETYNVLNTLYFPFGFPVISGGVVIDGNGATIQRDVASVENFDLLAVSEQQGLILSDVTITGANGDIGAVTSFFDSELQVFNSTISNNLSTGLTVLESQNSGVHNSTIVNNASSTLLYQFSGGLSVSNSSHFKMKGNVIYGNTGGYSGGVMATGVSGMVIQNNTVSANVGSAAEPDSGGAFFILGDNVHLQHNTITQNMGSRTGGVYVSVENFITLNHNIISGNELHPSPAPMIKAGANSAAEVYLATANSPDSNFNVIGQNGNSGTNGWTLGFNDVIPAGGVETVIDSQLALNGGETLSHLPLENGDAVDINSDTECDFSRTDQRGFIRPWDGNGDGLSACDAGAIELNSVHEDDLIFKDGFDEDINP